MVDIPLNQKKAQENISFGLFYKIVPSKWYKTYPFYFEIVNNNNVFTFYLPIPPQSMNIQDMSTSEAHATLGGVVEETSEPVFHMISLTGTTGLSTSATSIGAAMVNNNSNTTGDRFNVNFRKFIDNLNETTNPLSRALRSVVDNTVEGLSNILNVNNESPLQYARSGSAVLTGNDSISLTSLSTRSTAANDGFFKKLYQEIESPFAGDNGKEANSIYANGYAWSHAMRQFFLIYRREKAKNPDLALYFIDGKAGTRFRCVPRNIAFSQSAKNPFVVSYNLVLKCWIENNTLEIRGQAPQIDRFGPGGDLEEVNIRNATSLISSTLRTINNFRRPSGVISSFTRNATTSVL